MDRGHQRSERDLRPSEPADEQPRRRGAIELPASFEDRQGLGERVVLDQDRADRLAAEELRRPAAQAHRRILLEAGDRPVERRDRLDAWQERNRRSGRASGGHGPAQEGTGTYAASKVVKRPEIRSVTLK